MLDVQVFRFKTRLTMSDAFVHILVWLVISLVTLGIGLLFWPYSAAKLVANNTFMVDGSGNEVARLKCDLSAGTQIGHALLWYVLSLVTLGLALPFYFFGVARMATEKTRAIAVP